MPSKEELLYAFFQSSLPIVHKFLAKVVRERENDLDQDRLKLQASQRKKNRDRENKVILLIMKHSSKSKMVVKQLQSALSTFSDSVFIVEASSGKEAIEVIYDNPIIDLVFIDSAFALPSPNVSDAGISEILYHLNYSESSRYALSVCLTANTVLNPDILRRHACDFVWTAPLPSKDTLALSLQKILC
jgi:CheY-like chemotaxis protein